MTLVIGIGVGIGMMQRSSPDAAIRALFANGEAGAWFEPGPTTCFQTTAGIVPSGVGDPVGLILDRSKGAGYAGGQFTGLGAPIANTGIVLSGAVDNGNGTFTVSDGGSAAPRFTFPLASLSNGSTYEITFEVLSGTASISSDLCDTSGVSGLGGVGQKRYLGRRDTYDSTYRFVDVVVGSSGGCTFTAPVLRELPGNHATQATSGARPTLQQDSGGRYYLSFDGVDDFLVTPTITPGTDKVQVFAGIQRNTNSGVGAVVEFSPITDSNNGSFYLLAPHGPESAGLKFLSKGTSQAARAVSLAGAPVSTRMVATGLGDISGDISDLRYNGSSAGALTTDQGAGNYLAYPMYIGNRSSGVLPLSGRLYSLIPRFGPNLSAAQIAATEAYVASKTGVVL